MLIKKIEKNIQHIVFLLMAKKKLSLAAITCHPAI